MKISLNWIKDYVNINEDLNILANKITKAGVNVESVINHNVDNLVIGQIEKVEKHPDSDHLNVCLVNIGKEKLQIVCGASNVRKNLKVIVAQAGAILPGEFQIKKSIIRGVESNGMICALFELGLEAKTEETYSKGIFELDDDAPVGVNPIKYLNLDDTIYDLDLNPNRNDCLSHIGFAYELAAVLGEKVKLPNDEYTEVDESIKNHIELLVETDNCPLYTAKMVKNVVIKESPDFIKQRLINAGMRPINNVVDISNYIMLEYGQPLHFFDKEKLGSKILVRMAKENEKTITLDKKERTLSKDDIVITDGDKIVCIAGVMGSLNSDVDEYTKDIVIESAIFNPYNVRYTSIKLDLRSEASLRYEKGLNPDYTSLAINRACHLLEKYADGVVLKDKLVHDKLDKKEKVVITNKEKINSLLGMTLTEEDIKSSLDRLGFEYELKNKEFKVIIPNRRIDVEPRNADITEEVGRLYGYEKIISTLPIGPTKPGNYVGNVKYRKMVSNRLRSLGLNETRTYTLISEEDNKLFNYNFEESIKLLKPMSLDKSIIRQSILPSLLKVVDYNLARNQKDINIYEISNTYSNDKETLKLGILMLGKYIENSWSKNEIKVDFYLLKGIVENLLDYLGFKNRYSFQEARINEIHPGISAEILLDREPIGFIGKIHPLLSKEDIYLGEINLNKVFEKTVKTIKYREPSKYPLVIKDMAFIVSKNVTSEVIENIIRKTGGRILTNVSVFDVYDMGDEKSIAYSLTFSDSNKTLTDNEVSEVFNKIITAVETKISAKLRG